MKVSGAETVNLDRATLTVLRAEETAYIQVKSKQLNEQGKHVINIVHGTLQQGSFGYRKTLTFLWEADDEDPAYRKFIYHEKCEQIREKYQKKCEDAKALLKKDEERFNNAIKWTEKRIRDGEDAKGGRAGIVLAKDIAKETLPRAAISILSIIAAILWDSTFYRLFVVVFLIAAWSVCLPELYSDIKSFKHDKEVLNNRADEMDRGEREKLMREIEKNRQRIRDLPKDLERQVAQYKQEMEQELADAKAAIADIEN